MARPVVRRRHVRDGERSRRPALLEAAARPMPTTPWLTGDGTRWSVVFRPLLPDETGCADLDGLTRPFVQLMARP